MNMSIISVKKACQKLNALIHLAYLMNVVKKRIIMKAFIESLDPAHQFVYSIAEALTPK